MTSDRLTFTKIKIEDAATFHEVLSNHEHMRFTTKTNSMAESERCFRNLASQWDKYGFGAWRVSEIESGEAVGWGGIIVDEEDPGNWGPELVYFLHPNATGKGYATELGRAAIHYAFNIADLEKLVAFAKPENTASCKLLEKLGFTKGRFVVELGRYYYEISPSG